jgi:hypothetical protein
LKKNSWQADRLIYIETERPGMQRHRGAAQKKSTDPPVHLLNLRPTHPPSDFFFLDFFLGKFLGVSRQGEFKNTIQIFWQKVRVENFSQNFDKNFDVSFSSTFFALSHFRVFFSDGSSKTLQKTFCNKIVSKSFYKKIDQKSKTDFFSNIFLSRFWAFLEEGSSKTRFKKYRKNKSDPSPFLASDPPTHHGGHRNFFYWRPLAMGGWVGAG